jgi:hypothetical protein
MPRKPSEQTSPFESARRRKSSAQQPAESLQQRQGDRASGTDDDNDDDDDDVDVDVDIAQRRPRKFLPGPAVCRRYGITDMSLFRWLRSPDVGFPPPTMVISGRRYWDVDTLRAWEIERQRRTAVA